MPTAETITANGISRSSIRGFPVKRFALAAILLVAISVTGFISLDRVKGKASLIVADTLPGISEAGLANADLTEDFNCAVLMVMAATPAERNRYRDKSVQFATQSQQHLDAYEKAIFTPGDRSNFELMKQRRREYLETRDQVFNLMTEGRQAEAWSLCRNSLLPAYKSSKTAGGVLLDYNAHLGQLRGETIMRFCRFTQYAVAGCAIALFLLGFIIGVFR